MDTTDTIAAISSTVGAAARMIVRLSGPDSLDFARSVAPNAQLAHAQAEQTDLFIQIDGSNLPVPCWIYSFHHPRSYTGDHLVEFHMPGNPLLCKILIDTLINGGARSAEPGEYTARAYLNRRLDLASAEGVAATISAQNDAELQAARQLLSGELSRRLNPIMDDMASVLALLEAGIDFVEEDISFISPDDLQIRINTLQNQLDHLLKNTSRFESLSHHPRFVLLGRPNAGKSTLINALAGQDRAIVSPVAGTTRDVLSAQIHLARGEAVITDVAGLETVTPDASDQSPQAQIARQMQVAAMSQVETADFVILVRDQQDIERPIQLMRGFDLVVYTKADLSPANPDNRPLTISAQTGQGIEQLRKEMDLLAFGQSFAASKLALNARHTRAIDLAIKALARANNILTSPAEIIAMELREALDALGQVLGNITPDDVLGRVFSTFCIGK